MEAVGETVPRGRARACARRGCLREVNNGVLIIAGTGALARAINYTTRAPGKTSLNTSLCGIDSRPTPKRSPAARASLDTRLLFIYIYF